MNDRRMGNALAAGVRQTNRLAVLDGLPDDLKAVVKALPAPDEAEIPHDPLGEEAIVAALMLDGDALHRVLGEGCQPSDFYDPRLRDAFAAAVVVAERGDEITIPSVAFEMRCQGTYQEGFADELWLVDVTGKHFTAVGVETHARIVKNCSAARSIMQLSGQIAAVAKVAPNHLSPLLEYAKDALDGIQSMRPVSGTKTAADTVKEMLERGQVESRAVAPTYLGPLDRALGGGFGFGELVTAAAGTSVGKTALMARISAEWSRRGNPVGIVLVEGTREKWMHRVAACEAGVSLVWAQEHGWGPGEKEDYWSTIENLEMYPLHFADPTPRTPQAIEQWMRLKARREGVKRFIVDHIDRVQFPVRDRHDLGVRDAVTRWGNLATEEMAVVVALSQVNRQNEWHPSLSQLRESGAKEENSQIVLLMSQGLNDTFTQRTRNEHTLLYGNRRGIPFNIEVAKVSEGVPGMVGGIGERSPFYLDAASGAVRVNE